MRQEVPMPVAIGVIVVVLLIVVGAYLLLGRPRSSTVDVRMNPHGPGKLTTPPPQPPSPATPK
jgi:hypothetical protein